MSKRKQFDAFLSHNSEDKPVVEAVGKWLEDENGLRVWLDKWNLVPGDPWQEELEEALDASRCCVVFLGPNGIGPWQNEEMRTAIDKRVSEKSIRVVPVLLPGAMAPHTQKDFPRFVRRLTWVEFRKSWDESDSLSRLVAGIQGVAPGRGDHSEPPLGDFNRARVVARGLGLYLRRRRTDLEESVRVVPDARPLPLSQIYIPVRVARDPKRDFRRDLDSTAWTARGKAVPFPLWASLRDPDTYVDVRSWSSVRRELSRPTILLGDPGYGKSTTLAFEFVERAREWEESLAEGKSPGKLPVHLEASDLAHAKDPNEAVVESVLAPLRRGEPALISLVEQDVRRRLERGEIQLMLDALDESELKVDGALKILWNSSGRRLGIVLTSRIAGFEMPSLPQLQWQVYELTAWQEPEIARFVEGQFQAEPSRGREVLARLRSNASLRGMAQVPILLALLCWLAEFRGEIPRTRRDLYREFLRRLLTRPRTGRSPDRVSAKLQMLGHLALAFQRAGRDYMDQEWIESFIEGHPRYTIAFGARSPEDALAELSKEDGLLVRTSRELSSPLYFLHRTIQEFLAATALSKDKDWLAEARAHFWFEPRWQEVIVLLAGELGDRAEELLDAILVEEDDIFGSMLLLAVRCAGEIPRLSSALSERIDRQLTKIQAGSGAVIRQSVAPILRSLGVHAPDRYPRLYGSLMEQLRSKEKSDRYRTLLDIGEIGAVSRSIAPALYAALLEGLRDSHSQYVHSAGKSVDAPVTVLARLGLHEDEVIREVLALSKDANGELSRRATEVLARIGSADQESRAAVVAGGAFALKSFAEHHPIDEQMRKALLRELEHDNPYHSSTAARTLSRNCSGDSIVREALIRTYERWAEKLRRSTRVGNPEEVLREFHFALAEMGLDDIRVRNALLAALGSDQHSRVRDGAAFALGSVATDLEVRDALVNTLHTTDPFVKIAAAESLARHGSWTEPVKKALLGGLRGGWNAALWAADAFRRVGGVDRNSAEELVWWITHERNHGDVEEDDYYLAQQASADALREVNLDECGAVPALVDAMRYALDPDTRCYAAFALSRWTGSEVEEACDVLRNWMLHQGTKYDRDTHWAMRVETALRELATRLRRKIEG